MVPCEVMEPCTNHSWPEASIALKFFAQGSSHIGAKTQCKGDRAYLAQACRGSDQHGGGLSWWHWHQGLGRGLLLHRHLLTLEPIEISLPSRPLLKFFSVSKPQIPVSPESRSLKAQTAEGDSSKFVFCQISDWHFWGLMPNQQGRELTVLPGGLGLPSASFLYRMRNI